MTADLVSACGLFCGACHKYKKGKCPGCRGNEAASWCKIRICIRDKGIADCSGCTDFSDVDQCKKFNTLFARFFSLVFRSDRKAGLERIARIGREAYAGEMDAANQVVLKK